LVKDRAGNITRSQAAKIVVEADDGSPVLTDFSADYCGHGLSIDIEKIVATDNEGVVAYLVSEEKNTPLSDSELWSEIPPQYFIASGCGEVVLSVWAKDLEGNISQSLTSKVFVKLGHEKKALLVGPRHQFQTISAAVSAANEGDIIEIDAGIYENDFCVIRKNNLTLRGVGGYAHIIGTKKIKNGKGLIVQQCNNLTLENLELSGAFVADKNGAGIRGGGGDLTIEHCYIHDNENGLLVGIIKDGKILIENSIFEKNGYGRGQTHNIYVGNIKSLKVRFSYISDANVGHNIKSRATENFIEYNAILEKKSKTSYSIDLPNGGYSYIIGNIIQQGERSDNHTIISYKQSDSLSWNPGKKVYIINNTIINDHRGMAYVLKANSKTKDLVFKNNIVYGNRKTKIWVKGHKKPTMSGNLIVTNNPGFQDKQNFDFNLTAEALSAINHGVEPGVGNNYSLVPQYQYKNVADKAKREFNRSIDIGAYEFDGCNH